MSFDPVAHGNRFNADYYRAMPALPDNQPIAVEIPCPEIYEHMATIRDVAANSTAVIELGPFLGTGSTQAIRQGLDEGEGGFKWVTVDVVDHMHPWLKPCYPFWSLIIGDSIDPQTVDHAGRALYGHAANMIFIDTVHTYEHLKKELELWSRLAAPTCTWLFHDTWMGGIYNPMTDAIKEFAQTHKNWEYADISKRNNGLGALMPI